MPDLCLGTANFGMSYGHFSSHCNDRHVLGKLVADANFGRFETADSYGNLRFLKPLITNKSFSWNHKISLRDGSKFNMNDDRFELFGREPDALYFHDPEELLHLANRREWNQVIKMRQFRSMGVNVDFPYQFEKLREL